MRASLQSTANNRVESISTNDGQAVNRLLYSSSFWARRHNNELSHTTHNIFMDSVSVLAYVDTYQL